MRSTWRAQKALYFTIDAFLLIIIYNIFIRLIIIIIFKPSLTANRTDCDVHENAVFVYTTDDLTTAVFIHVAPKTLQLASRHVKTESKLSILLLLPLPPPPPPPLRLLHLLPLPRPLCVSSDYLDPTLASFPVNHHIHRQNTGKFSKPNRASSSASSSSSSSSSCGSSFNGRCRFHEWLPCRRLARGKHFSWDVPGSSLGKRGQVGWPKTWRIAWNCPWGAPTLPAGRLI